MTIKEEHQFSNTRKTYFELKTHCRPKFKHECENCTYVGRIKEEDKITRRLTRLSKVNDLYIHKDSDEYSLVWVNKTGDWKSRPLVSDEEYIKFIKSLIEEMGTVIIERPT